MNPMNVIAFLLLALATPVFGQLKWENPEQTFTAKPLDKVIVAKFRFTNVGTTSLKITDVHPSCGCTTTFLKKTEYAPGETGEIEAKFKFDGRVGHHEKWIVVTTDWVPPQPTILRMAVNIPVSALVKLAVAEIVQNYRSKFEKWPGLIIDVKEDQIITDLALATDLTKKLDHLNVKLAVDNFGRADQRVAVRGTQARPRFRRRLRQR